MKPVIGRASRWTAVPVATTIYGSPGGGKTPKTARGRLQTPASLCAGSVRTAYRSLLLLEQAARQRLPGSSLLRSAGGGGQVRGSISFDAPAQGPGRDGALERYPAPAAALPARTAA